MKYSVIAVLFVSFIAGCGQNAPTTQNPQPVTTATVVTVKASPVAAASPVSKTATQKVKNPYPPEAIANYLDVCGKSGNSKAYCDCSINKAQDLYTINEFSEAYALAASGKKSGKMDKVLSSCTLKRVSDPPVKSQKETLATIGNTSPSNSMGMYSIKGSFSLIDSRIEGNTNNCYGTGGYSDIQGGMSITIKNGTGAIIGTGSTESGQRAKGGYASVHCIFEFTVDNLPRSDFYSISIGRRGESNFSFEELQKRNWTISLSLE